LRPKGAKKNSLRVARTLGKAKVRGGGVFRPEDA
jgi:hypothetical protein